MNYFVFRYVLTRRVDNPMGLIYTLNFSTPFNMSQNISEVFKTKSKTGGSAATNLAPNYFDGALLANDDEFFLYGGLLLKDVEAYDEPDGDRIRVYQGYQYGVERDSFTPGSFQEVQLHNLTRYIAYGGAANVPSENKAFYFSGMQSPSHGSIYYPGSNDSQTAVNVSDTLITVDMSTQGSETWTNVTLPDSIPGRANPELVWVPVGSQGILVALGGVIYPEFVDSTHISENATESVSTLYHLVFFKQTMLTIRRRTKAQLSCQTSTSTISQLTSGTHNPQQAVRHNSPGAVP